MKLVASLIVRNELYRYLPVAVDHLLSFCDELRILDDNSDDGTYEWLVGQAVHRPIFVRRNSGPAFFEYESQARQQLLEWTMEAEPGYVLSIDADEFVHDPDVVLAKCREGLQAYTLSMQEVWQATQQNLSLRVDGMWGPRLCPILWKAPRRLTAEWAIPDRKLACGREPHRVRFLRPVKSGTTIYHFGWTNEAGRRERAERYFEHDQGKFHQDRHLQSILDPDDKVHMVSILWPRALAAHRDAILGRVRLSREEILESWTSRATG